MVQIHRARAIKWRSSALQYILITISEILKRSLKIIEWNIRVASSLCIRRFKIIFDLFSSSARLDYSAQQPILLRKKGMGGHEAPFNKSGKMDFCLIRRSENPASASTSYWCMFIVCQLKLSLISLSNGSYSFSASEWHSLNAPVARGRPNERNRHCALSLKSTVDRCEQNRAYTVHLRLLFYCNHGDKAHASESCCELHFTSMKPNNCFLSFHFNGVSVLGYFAHLST